jgi:uncharacterized OB-fold protein
MANSQRYTREIPHRFRLEAQKFADGFVSLPNRYVSPLTGTKEFEPITLSGVGTILSYTIIHTPADTHKQMKPFPVAIIETPEGARITAMVTDTPHENVKIGAKVRFLFRKMMEEGHSGIINYGYKAIVE